MREIITVRSLKVKFFYSYITNVPITIDIINITLPKCVTVNDALNYGVSDMFKPNHQDYDPALLAVLHQIESVMPIYCDPEKSQLRASFARVASSLENGARGVHNDFGEVAKTLLGIAMKQPALRDDALALYNRLPLAGYAPTEWDMDLVRLCRDWLDPEPSHTVEFRLEALSALVNEAVEEAGNVYRNRSKEILRIIYDKLEFEKEPRVRQAISDGLSKIRMADLNAVQTSLNAVLKSTQSLGL